MNVKYRRQATPELIAKVQRDSVCVLALWGTVAALAAAHVVPWRVFLSGWPWIHCQLREYLAYAGRACLRKPG